MTRFPRRLYVGPLRSFSSFLRRLALVSAAVAGLGLGLVASGTAQVDRVLYCMPAGHPALRADGTWGLAVDLAAGQPSSDPAYAGAVPAVALFSETVLSWAPFVYVTSYVLTCDISPEADCVQHWVQTDPPGLFDGPYPICEPYAIAVLVSNARLP
ncbi:MAG TPA: hypothetical protein VFA97_12615 [Gaiellaceae bacterium]|nr:hypothetical protein [Gaiellaceae bacterium]